MGDKGSRYFCILKTPAEVILYPYSHLALLRNWKWFLHISNIYFGTLEYSFTYIKTILINIVDSFRPILSQKKSYVEELYGIPINIINLDEKYGKGLISPREWLSFSKVIPAYCFLYYLVITTKWHRVISYSCVLKAPSKGQMTEINNIPSLKIKGAFRAKLLHSIISVL